MVGPHFLVPSFLIRIRFQKSVRRYLVSNLDDDLKVAKGILQRLLVSENQPKSLRRKIVITGWLSRNTNGGIRAEHLESLNPGYRVKISRGIRRDLLVHRKAYGYFCSFKIQLIQNLEHQVSQDRVKFVIGKEASSLQYLSASNPRAKKVIADLLSPHPRGATRAVGFIDAISESIVSGSGLDSIVLGATEELIAFAKSENGRFICSRANDILRSNGRKEQAEQFAFIGKISNANFQVFQEVSVTRHFQPKKTPSKRSKKIRMQSSENGVVEAQTTLDSVLSPGKGWLDLHGVDLLGGALVLNDGTLENYEHVADPTWDFVSGLWQIQFGSPTRQDCALIKTSTKKTIPLGESILMGGRNDFNYYHFMVEYLPRLLTIPTSVDKSVPVLISKTVPRSGKQALRKLTDRKIVEIDPKKIYRIKRLHVSAPVAQVLDTTKVPWADGVFVDLSVLREFRETCLSLLDVSSNPIRRIYLRRESSHRNLINGEQLERLASKMGFEVIDVIGMSWEDQVSLFASARVVVGAGGAVMANYIFLPSGAKVISLTSEYLSDFSLPAYLASVANASFTYITGKPRLTRESRRNTQRLMHSGFRIKKSTFRRVLKSSSS
jgi:hypothetical protein